MRVFPLSFSVVFAHSRESDVRTVVVLAYRGHLLTGNRNGLVVSTLTTRAYGSTERIAALLMAESATGETTMSRSVATMGMTFTTSSLN